MQTSTKYKLKKTTPTATIVRFECDSCLAIPWQKILWHYWWQRESGEVAVLEPLHKMVEVATFLIVSLSTNGKRANGQRFFTSQVISSYSLVSLYFVKVLEFLSSGDCPSHASTCYGKTALLFTLLWLSTKVSCFYPSCNFSYKEFAGVLWVLSLETCSLGALPGAERAQSYTWAETLCRTLQKANVKYFVAHAHTEELTGLVLTSSLHKPLSFSGLMELPDSSTPSLAVNKTVFSTWCLNSSVSNFKYVFHCHFCASVFSVA